LKRIIFGQFNRNEFELRKSDLYPISPVVNIMNYGNIDLVVKRKEGNKVPAPAVKLFAFSQLKCIV